MKHLVQRLTLTAALLVLTGAIPRHLAAGESLPCLHEIEITCVPDRLIIGSTPFTTWRINGVDQFGHQVDQVFTWDHVDRMNMTWWNGVTLQGESDGFAQSSAQRRLPLAHDQVLAFPIEIIHPGWRMFFHVSTKPFPCDVRYWWTFGQLTRSKPGKIALVLPAIPPDSLPVLEPAPLIEQFIDGSSIPITATMDSLTVRSTAEDLVFSVTRLDPACDRPEAWACASIEWIRLPMLDGEPTVIYSPFRAGVRRAQAGAGAAQPSVLPRQLRFPVQDALRDPRSGSLLPGNYVVRLAMAFLSPTPEGQQEMLLARSRHWTIQVHAPGQPPEAVQQPRH